MNSLNLNPLDALFSMFLRQPLVTMWLISAVLAALSFTFARRIRAQDRVRAAKAQPGRLRAWMYRIWLPALCYILTTGTVIRLGVIDASLSELWPLLVLVPACWVAALIASIVERHSDRFCFAKPAEAAMCRGLITFTRTQMAWILALLLLLVFGGALAGMLTMTDA